ncbi:MAG: GntR family transcriptional regulator [Sulfitobacter sp.]
MQKNSTTIGSAETAKQPVHQSVYEQLRTRVLFGELAPGQAVTIHGLTQELGVGMTPIREAIRRLISDGALTMQGNRRVSVPVLTAGCVDQLDFMRQNLEPQLARLAAERMTPPDLAGLRDHDNALNQAIATGDIPNYLRQNYRFHATLYACADAPILEAIVDRLWLRFGPSLRVVCGRWGTMSLPDKHMDLLGTLERGDAEAAAKAMAEDVHQGMLQIRSSLDVGDE